MKQTSNTSHKYTLRKNPPKRNLNNPQQLNNPQSKTISQNTHKRPPPTPTCIHTLNPNIPPQERNIPLIYNPYAQTKTTVPTPERKTQYKNIQTTLPLLPLNDDHTTYPSH